MAYIEIPKGNGKTPLLAAIVLLMLFWDCEIGAEAYSAAGDREQARLVFDDARNMLEQSPELMARSKVLRHRIVLPEERSFYRVLSADAPTKHGFKPHLIAFDELHVQPNRRLFDTLRTGLTKRRQPLMISITTAGEYDEESLCWQEHEYAQAVIDGEIEDPAYYAVIYAAEPDADWTDETVWADANPNLGISVKLDGLRDECRVAKNSSPAVQAAFKQLHLNIWAQDSQGIVPLDRWRECNGEIVRAGPCYVGMDLSSKLDLTAVAAWWPETGSVDVMFWVPADNLVERQRREIFDYQSAVRDGWIVATEGNYVDQQAVRTHIVELAEQYEVIECGFDPWNAVEIARQLQEEDGIEMIEVRQGSKTLSDPLKSMIGMIKNVAIRHGDNPVLNWNMANLKAKRDENDNWRPVKDKGGRKRIDGPVAWLAALTRAQLADTAEPMIYS